MCKDGEVWLFVYGTLKVGGTLHTGFERLVKKDTVKGTLYSRNHVPFPFYHRGGDRDIKGELHLVPSYLLRYYDEVEGGMYRRVNIVTESGVPAQIYEIVFDPEANQLIVNENNEFKMEKENA